MNTISLSLSLVSNRQLKKIHLFVFLPSKKNKFFDLNTNYFYDHEYIYIYKEIVNH